MQARRAEEILKSRKPIPPYKRAVMYFSNMTREKGGKTLQGHETVVQAACRKAPNSRRTVQQKDLKLIDALPCVKICVRQKKG